MVNPGGTSSSVFKGCVVDDGEGVGVTVGVRVSDGVTEPVRLKVDDEVGEVDAVIDGVELPVTVGVTEAESETVGDEVVVAEPVDDIVSVADRDTVDVTDTVAVNVAVSDADKLFDDVSEIVGDQDAVDVGVKLSPRVVCGDIASNTATQVSKCT
jgi:hypothetical protein